MKSSRGEVHIQKGDLAELMVATEVCRRGWQFFRSLMSGGAIDGIIVDQLGRVTKVQIKSVRGKTRRDKQRIVLRDTCSGISKDRYQVIDFFIGVDQDRGWFWVIPAAEKYRQTRITLGNTSPYREAWQLIGAPVAERRKTTETTQLTLLEKV
jgi:hypothetical protein